MRVMILPRSLCLPSSKGQVPTLLFISLMMMQCVKGVVTSTLQEVVVETLLSLSRRPISGRHRRRCRRSDDGRSFGADDDDNNNNNNNNNEKGGDTRHGRNGTDGRTDGVSQNKAWSFSSCRTPIVTVIKDFYAHCPHSSLLSSTVLAYTHCHRRRPIQRNMNIR